MAISQAILPVAGFGTRFLPWTKAVPKELLPIGTTPIIALLVDECMSVGIREICFVISKGKEAIAEYFAPHPELAKEMEARGKAHMLAELEKYDEVKFHIVYQHEMKGDGHAILQAKEWVTSDALAVLFGDDLIVGKENGLQQLVKAHAQTQGSGAMLCLERVPKEHVSKYGIVDLAESGHIGENIKKIAGLVEKPKPEDAPSDLGIVGKYLIPRSTISALATIGHGSVGGEVRLIDGLIAELGAIDIYGCVFAGTRYDTGTPEGYKRAVVDLG